MFQSRSKNALYNLFAGGLYKALGLLMNFILRTVFIYTLGKNYLGLNSLFITVLNVLSLTELGVSSAITFYLYKPIAEDNAERIKSIMLFYKRAYLAIGVAVAIIGLSIIPFLNYLVNFDTELAVNLYLVYIIYLSNSVASYFFFAYMQSLLVAMQKQYVINAINIIFLFISTIICSIILLWLHNYILYLIAKLVIGIINNYVIRQKSLSVCPYIKDKHVERLGKLETKRIFHDVSSIFLFRVSSTLSDSIDTILISVILGTVYAGYNSNYELLATGILGIITMIIYSFSAGIGNLSVSESVEKRIKVFREINLLNYFIATVAFCGMSCLSNDFILIWLKDGNFVYPVTAVWCKAFYMFLVASLTTCFAFRESMGLFKYGKYRNLIAGIVNFVLTIILTKLIGITGVFLASSIACLCIAYFVFPKIIFKYGFQVEHRKEQFTFFLRCVISCLIGFANYLLLTPLRNNLNYLTFALEVLFTVVFSVGCLLFIYWRDEEFQDLLLRAQRIINARFGKVRVNEK